MNRIRSQPKLLLIFVLTLIFASFGIPHYALATKSLPPHVKILLGFKERYGKDNKLHYGIDVYAKKGTELYAPVEGIISFAGRVPGSAGLNVTALTITTKEGHQVSINPFASTKVQRGDAITHGQVLGTVSDVGDPSSPESHFHLSLREGGVYRDPTRLLMEDVITSGGSEKNSTSAPSVAVSAPPSSAAGSTAPEKSMSSQTQAQTQVSKAGVSSKVMQKSMISEKRGVGESPQAKTKTITQKEGNQAGNSAAPNAESRDSEILTESKTNAAVNSSKNAENGENVQGSGTALRDSELIQHLNTAGFMAEQVSPKSIHAAGTTLQLVQSDGLGLRAEFTNYLSNLSQAQLSAGMIGIFFFLSIAGLGTWKLLQLAGFDSILAEARERLSYISSKKLKREDGAA